MLFRCPPSLLKLAFELLSLHGYRGLESLLSSPGIEVRSLHPPFGWRFVSSSGFWGSRLLVFILRVMGWLKVFIILSNLSSDPDWLVPTGLGTYLWWCTASQPKDNSGFSQAKAVFGSTLSLPGEFLKHSEIHPEIFLHQVEQAVLGFSGPPRHHIVPQPQPLPQALLDTEFVFVHDNALKPSLSPL